jgi:hypothetical protein
MKAWPGEEIENQRRNGVVKTAKIMAKISERKWRQHESYQSKKAKGVMKIMALRISGMAKTMAQQHGAKASRVMARRNGASAWRRWRGEKRRGIKAKISHQSVASLISVKMAAWHGISNNRSAKWQ